MAGLSVGLSCVDITPPLGTELCGFGPYLERKSEKVLEKLYAKTCIFKLARTRLALVQLDLVGILRPMTQEIRRRVTRSTGIPRKNIMLCCTHTHSGPNTIGATAWGQPNERYLKKLPRLIADGISKADRDYRPAKLRYGRVAVDGISYNRVRNPRHVDRRLAVVRVDVEGQPAAFIAHTSVHPVVLCQTSRYICGDFVGIAVNTVAKDFPGSIGLFLQGACGDINVRDPHRPVKEALKLLDKHSAALADRIREGLRRARPVAVERLKSVLRSVVLPQVRVQDSQVVVLHDITRLIKGCTGCPTDLDNWGRFLSDANDVVIRKLIRGVEAGLATEVQGFAVGDILILAQPAELFFTFYEQMRKKLAGRKLILAGYANDIVGYVPDRRSYDITPLPSARTFAYYAPYMVPLILGDYPFRPDVGDYLVGELLAVADALA